MNEFKKKQWARIGLSLIALIAASLFLTGLAGGKNMTYRIGDGAPEVTASEQGFGGKVTVHAVLNGDKTIKTLSIDTPDETAGLGQRASEEEFTGQFIGKAGPFAFGEDGIEALSGATVTSNAALKALNNVLSGEPAEEKPAEEKPAEEKPAEEKPAETAGEDAMTLSSSAQGFGGKVTVHAVLKDDNTIQSLTIDTPDETAGLGQRASEEAFTSQFIGKTGPFTYGKDGIEALSGATVTSEAALKAINIAVAGETGEEKPAEEKPAEEKPAEEKPAEETPAEGDTYASDQETPYSRIHVEVTVKDGKIVGCEITSKEKEPDFDFLTAKLKKEWAEAIVTAQTAETDVITGATLKLSSGAVREAMAEILNLMNGGSQEEEKPAEEKPAETAGEDAMTLSSSAQGFGGKVTVHAVLKDDNTIQSLTIDTPDETAGLGQRASEEAFTSQFIGKTGPFTFGKDGIEALSGATVTSEAALKAINIAVAGETGEEKPAEEKPAEEKPAEEKPEEEKPAEEKNAETPAAVEKAEKTPAMFGGYLSVKETEYSVIRVIVSTKNGVITGCTITSEEKSKGSDFLKDSIRKEWADAIVAAQTAETDAITGATLKLSSAAVREAVAELLETIGGK